jgi:hypothetical protein
VKIRQTKGWKYGLSLLAVLAIGAMSAGLYTVWAQDANPMEKLLKDSGLEYRLVADGIWVVPFDVGEENTLDVTVVYTDTDKDFSLIYTTVVDKDDDYVFNREVLTTAMQHNNDYHACKFCLDSDNGDIDCQNELLMSTLTSEALNIYINQLASVADDTRQHLNELAR